MSYGVIAQDASIEVAIGEVARGQAPTFASALVITGRVDQMRLQAKKKKIDVGGLGWQDERNRYGKNSGELTLDTFVHSTGRLFSDAANGAYLGRYVRVRELPNSAGGDDPFLWIGVITDWETQYKNDDATMENVTIDLTPDYDA